MYGALSPRLARTAVAGSLLREAKPSSSMAVFRFKTGAPSVQTNTRAGFGRGSAVRQYWLERCQGFCAVRSDGRPLGRVKGVEVNMEGTFLRLTGVRGRTVPLSAVDRVWPAESVLLISNEEYVERSRVVVPKERHRARPAWEDETLPWWELVPDPPHPAHSSTAVTESALFRAIASGPLLIEGARKASASHLERLMKQALAFTRALVYKAARSSVAALHAADSARTRASKSLGAGARRWRRRLALAFLQGAVWIAGSKEELLGPDRARGGVEDEDTARIS
jgi:hypothetical protein